jgi:YidC/Oxa1 family membrane protein insertase
MMNKLALYVFPLGVVVGGPFLPLAIIFYWFANNIWTFAQQHYVFRMIEREDEEKKREAIERRSANAPAPGAKPKRSTRNAPAGSNGSSASDGAGGNGAAADPSEAGNPVSRAPRPGAKPKKRRR